MIVDGKHVKWASATGVGALSFLAWAIYASLSANRSVRRLGQGTYFRFGGRGHFCSRVPTEPAQKVRHVEGCRVKNRIPCGGMKPSGAHIWLGILSFLLVVHAVWFSLGPRPCGHAECGCC